MDGDGDLDLVGTSGVQLNNGSGTFAAAQQPDVSGSLLGDVDGDGDLDLAGITTANTVRVQLNNGLGTFAAATPLATISGIAGLATGEVAGKQLLLGDVDGDGTLDLLAATGTLAGVSVRLNQTLTSTLRVPENPAGTVAGLTYQYYESATGSFTELPDFTTLTPKKTGFVSNFDPLSVRDRSQAYAIRYAGYITVPTDGQYTFFTSSDDGSQLFIGSALVVDNDGLHAVQERAGTIGLQAGMR